MNRNTKLPSRIELCGFAGWGGITGWIVARFRNAKKNAPRLALLERITLGPRQSLALVEAEGRRLLVATSAEGGPAFYVLDDRGSQASRTARQSPSRSARVSW